MERIETQRRDFDANLIACARAHGFPAYYAHGSGITVEIPFHNRDTGENGAQAFFAGNFIQLRDVLGY